MIKADRSPTAMPCNQTGEVGRVNKTGRSANYSANHSVDCSTDLDRFKRQMLADEPAATVAEKQSPQGSPGDTILKNLHNGQRLGSFTQPLETAKLEPLIQRMVDRILVSAAGADEQTEVRIRLTSEQLGNTEIRLQRYQGELQVQVITPTVDIERTMLQLKGGLQQALQEKLMTLVVTVEVSAEGSSDGQQDGRSRNPYMLMDVADTQEEEQKPMEFTPDTGGTRL